MFHPTVSFPYDADHHTCPHIKGQAELVEQYLALQRHLHTRVLQRSGQRALPKCQECTSPGGRVHGCMECATFHCWQEGHMKAHHTATKHRFAVDTTHMQVYCFECGDYVYDTDLERAMNRERNQAFSRCMQYYDPNPNRTAYVDWQPDKDEREILEAHAKRRRVFGDAATDNLGGVGSGKPVATAVEPGLRGFNNLGSTCFMSCILQAFLHNAPLRNYFLSDQHSKATCPTSKTGGKVCLACEMDTLFKQFFSGENKPYSPHELLYSVWTHAQHLAGYEQQDAHEFFIAFLNGLHQHCQGTRSNCTCIIHRVFTGALQSDVLCLQCNSVSTTVDPFWDISLDLHQHTAGPIMAKNNKGKNNDSVPTSLVDCLNRFTKPERLGSDQKLLCNKCNSMQERTKQLSLKHLPIVVCFHLKRFEHSTTSTKIKASIDFPARLDIGPYLSSTIIKKRERLSRQHGTGSGTDDANNSDVDGPGAPTSKYSLFAVVNHHGSLHTGHYTAFVRHTDQWFQCDDASVTTATIEQVLASEGYLLFYIKETLDYEKAPTK